MIYLIIALNLISCQVENRNNEKNAHKDLIQEKIITPLENENLRGDIKSIMVSEYKGKIENGIVVKDFSYGKYGSTYDKNGKKIETVSFSKNKETPWRKGVYKYADNRLIEISEIRFDEKGNKINEYPYKKYTYNNDDEITENWYSEKGKLNYKIQMKFDENGMKQSEFHENLAMNGREWEKKTFTYDSDKYLKKIDEENGVDDIKLRYEEVYELDKYGNIVERTRVNLKNLSKKTGGNKEYKYDSKGNWIKSISIDKNDGFIFIHERDIEYL